MAGTGFFDWAEAHSGAITALASVLLAILTGVYVVLTRSLANSAKRTAEAAAATVQLFTSQARRSLPVLVTRLIELLNQLPKDKPSGDTTLRNVTLWTANDLQMLEQLAQAIPESRLFDASTARANLQWISERVADVLKANEVVGYRWNAKAFDDWPRKYKAAMDALVNLRGSNPYQALGGFEPLA